jgi:hypothetical protein
VTRRPSQGSPDRQGEKDKHDDIGNRCVHSLTKPQASVLFKGPRLDGLSLSGLSHMYTCLTMNMSVTANIDTPTAHIASESNCVACGYDFRQCAIFNSPAFKNIVTHAG